MPKIQEHNVETGEILEREMNEEELEKWEANQASAQAETERVAQAAAAKAALLEKLGITEDEAKLLLS